MFEAQFFKVISSKKNRLITVIVLVLVRVEKTVKQMGKKKKKIFVCFKQISK